MDPNDRREHAVKLSEHFWLHEVDSPLADVPEYLIDPLSEFFKRNAEDIRRTFRAPMIITSGYRDAEWNARVKGKNRSFHRYDLHNPEGEVKGVFAIDFVIMGRTGADLATVHDFIRGQFDVYEATDGVRGIEPGGLKYYPATQHRRDFIHYDNRGEYVTWR